MAPVGSRDSLAAALKAGAGSVYFGVEQLNMRSHSANHFTIDDLREIAATCSEHGVKSYLTVNTIIYGEDLELMHQIVDAAKEAKITAIIASDVAAIGAATVRKTATEFVPASLFNLFIDLPIYLLKPR